MIADLITPAQVEARPYQLRIIDNAHKSFCDENLRSVLVESPTGSGKTIMGLLIAKALQQQLGARVGWVAMRRNLLSQARAENEEKQIRLDCQWISMFDRAPPADLEMLVVNEAQHDAAESMAHLHNVVRPRFILGLSATPFRTDGVKLCFDRVIRDAGIHRLIQDGYLSPYHHYTIPSYTPESVVECFAREPARWGKSLVYFHTLEQCLAASKLIRERGFRAEVVTGSSDRETQLAAFRAGQLDLLINCQVLAEGFDCPELATVFCRPSCRGATIQMCGRVFRKHAATPIKQIVQCRNTPWPLTRTAAAAMQYTWLNGGWRSLQLNAQIEQVSGRTLRALAQIDVRLPKLLSLANAEAIRHGLGRRRSGNLPKSAG